MTVVDTMAKDIISISNKELRKVYDSRNEGRSNFQEDSFNGIVMRGVEPPHPEKYGKMMTQIPFLFHATDDGTCLFNTSASLYYNTIIGLRDLITRYCAYAQSVGQIPYQGELIHGIIFVATKGKPRIAKVVLQYREGA